MDVAYRIIETEGKKILVRKFFKVVKLNTILQSWNYIFQAYNQLEGFHGVMHDFTDADLTMTPEDLKKLLEFLDTHHDKVGKLKMAVVIDNKNIYLPSLAIVEGARFKLKPFSSLDAAKHWLCI